MVDGEDEGGGPAAGPPATGLDEVVAAAGASVARCGATRVVAVDGRSGAGKSTLGRALAVRLGCELVDVEELCPGWDGLAEALTLLDSEVLAPLAAGRPATWQVWDWTAGGWGARRTVAPAPFVVVVGCGVTGPPPGDRAALRVRVEAPEGLRRQRALGRDGATYARHWERWARQEDQVLAVTPAPDLVVRTGPRRVYRVEGLVPPSPGLPAPAKGVLLE